MIGIHEAVEDLAEELQDMPVERIRYWDTRTRTWKDAPAEETKASIALRYANFLVFQLRREPSLSDFVVHLA